MKRIARSLSFLAVVTVLAACDASPLEPSVTSDSPRSASLSQGNGAERFVDEALYDLSDIFAGFECADGTVSELIELEGQIYERWSAVFNPAGGYHATLHTMPIGLRGIGTESGEEYRVKEQFHVTVSQSPMGMTGTFRSKVSLVGGVPKQTFELTIKGHWTMNANGEWVVERDTLSGVCR
jgi:hypothetical protein